MGALTYGTLLHTLYTKAERRGQNEHSGDNPSDDPSKFKIDSIDEIDICKKNGRWFLKAFYKGSQVCFYLDVPKSRFDDIVNALEESEAIDPFNDLLLVSEEESAPARTSTDSVNPSDEITNTSIAEDANIKDEPAEVDQNDEPFGIGGSKRVKD